MCTHLETYFQENIVFLPHIILYSEAIILNFSSLFCSNIQGCINSGRRFARLTKCCKVVPNIWVFSMEYSSEISPTRCNNSVFILRNGFTLHVSGDNLTHHQEYICCIWPQGKPAHLGCKFLSDVSVVNSPIVVELLVITALFCVVMSAEWR